MDSASFQFVIYGLAVAILSNLSQRHVWRSSVLFLASVVFLAMLPHNPIVLLPLAAFLLLGYAGATPDSKSEKPLPIAAVLR
jgi:hypothetical protein